MDRHTEFDNDRLARLRRNLRRWYSRHARDLPWRRTRDPYHIWISEIMLQQTTVAAVIPYYERFLAAFPDIHQLAAAREEDVLRLWEGLGYYSRARNIHATAQTVSGELCGRFPREVDKLQRLPGIGRYTAGAIASFAFDARAPIVEANTRRLYSRIIGRDGELRSSESQQLLWEFAERILPQTEIGRFNQALVELGATVCKPSEPECSGCPVQTCCTAFADGSQERIPAPESRPHITRVTEATVALQKKSRYLLRHRQDGERWAGLWDFVRFPLAENVADSVIVPRGRTSEEQGLFAVDDVLCKAVSQDVRELTGIDATVEACFAEMFHSVTRYRIRLLCFRAAHNSGRLNRSRQQRWVRPAEFDEYPLSVTARKVAAMLQSGQSQG